MPAYQVTGNEYVSLPAIREDTGAVQGVTVLHMGAKGLLELCGGDAPLIAPVVRVAGQEAMPAKLRWRRENAWVPVARGEAQGLTAVSYTHLDVYKRQCWGGTCWWRPSWSRARRDAPYGCRQAHGAISSLAKPFRAAGNATPNARWSAFPYTKG